MHKQKGLTLISWIIVLVYLLFQAVIAMKIIPVYITDASVKTIFKELPADPDARGLNTNQLRILIMKRLRMNSVYSLKPENIKIKRGRGENIVTINYAPTGKLLGNLDYIIRFHHETTVPLR